MQDGLRGLVLDPVVFNERRCEFVLPSEGAILPNLRLVGIAANSVAGATYGFLGPTGLIDQIDLYCGGDQVESIRHIPEWMAWKLTSADQRTKSDLLHPLHRSLPGIYTAGANEAFARDIDLGVDPTSTAWVGLNTLLGFLDAAQVLPMGKLGPMRIIIHWTADLNRIISTRPVPADVVIQRPQLLCEQVLNPKMVEKAHVDFHGVQFMTRETDEFRIPGVTAGTQTLRLNSRAAEGKFVNRVLWANNHAANPAQDGFLGLTSLADYNHRHRLVINGQPNTPFLAGDTVAARLSELSSVWGDVSPFTGAVRNSFNSMATGRIHGNQDYSGALVGERVRDFQLEWSRDFSNATGATFSQRNGGRELLQFMEVNKQLVYKDGKRDVLY